MTYNPIITITLKPTIGATAAIDAVETGKDHGTATVALSFEGEVPGYAGSGEAFVEIGDGGAMWDILLPQRVCGEVAELSAETALAVSTLLNKGFAMNAELNVLAKDAPGCCDDGPFAPPFPSTPGGTDEGDTIAAEVADFSNLEADAKAVSERLERAMSLIEMLQYADRIACKTCHGHSAVYGGADCPACHSCGYLTRSLQTATTETEVAVDLKPKKARKRK